ncbi:hypothetical protein [Modestobacter excelsi]|uniref:hypothetical protein n=1 Tax=Modestobacter excelsi TaxID=2213161 RepID=UPI00110D1573|nr:hypothetical protein [Modestobacter excelsi]
MAPDTVVYHPGQVVPASGIYRCDDGCGSTYESTDVRGHRFPPLPHGCSGTGWVLEKAAAHR